MVTEPRNVRKATIVRHVCAQVRRLLAAGELSPAEISDIVGCPVATVYTVRARLNKSGRAEWVNDQFKAMEKRIGNLEAFVRTVNDRVTVIELKSRKTRR